MLDRILLKHALIHFNNAYSYGGKGVATYLRAMGINPDEI
jgi:hypothetical protein